MIATSLYNFFACLLRALGNSTVPLVFLALSSILNIGLDLLFVVVFRWGIRGAAAATVVSQYVAGIGILLYVVMWQKKAHSECVKSKIECTAGEQKSLSKTFYRGFDPAIMKEILTLSSLTCLQQSVMNFGILMVQGLVNSFGATDAHFHPCKGNGGDRQWSAVSPYRGSLLFWNRLPFFAVWLLPRDQSGTDVRGADCDIAGPSRSACLRVVDAVRGMWHLGGNSDRMDRSRCNRTILYEVPESKRYKILR